MQPNAVGPAWLRSALGNIEHAGDMEHIINDHTPNNHNPVSTRSWLATPRTSFAAPNEAEVNLWMENDRELYNAHRKRFNELLRAGQTATAEAAALFYYLNRTCFNGLCRFNSSGEFNVPFDKYNNINYVRDFSAKGVPRVAQRFSVGFRAQAGFGMAAGVLSGGVGELLLIVLPQKRDYSAYQYHWSAIKELAQKLYLKTTGKAGVDNATDKPSLLDLNSTQILLTTLRRREAKDRIRLDSTRFYGHFD